MTIKMIALDLDDTLLNNKQEISTRTAQAIRQAVSKGVTVTMATGRMFCSAVVYAEQLELDVPLITYNGGLIQSSRSREIFLHQTVSAEIAHQILAFCRERQWYIQSYIDDVLYVKEMEDWARKYAQIARIEPKVMGEAFYHVPGHPTKIMMLGEPDEIRERRDMIQDRFGKQVYVTTSKPIFLEMMNLKVNKGRALAYLAEKLGIDSSEVMAIGDSNNDLDMIQYAGLGVAMGNAADHVKALANAVTCRNDEDGVAAAIEKYVLSAKA